MPESRRGVYGKSSQICVGCKVDKPIKFFRLRTDRKKTGGIVSYYYRKCKECETEQRRVWRLGKYREKDKAKKKEYYYEKKKEDPLFYKFKYALNGIKYSARVGSYTPCDITIDDLIELWTGLCFVCKRNGPSISIDHCHTTGKFRGFLCSNCNSALGHVHDDIDRLKALISYLEEQ